MTFAPLIRLLDQQGITYRRDEPLSRYTTFKIGGPAALLVRPSDVGQCAAVVKACKTDGLPYRIIGQGSNLLMPDEGLDAVVIVTTSIRGGLAAEGHRLTAVAGESLATLCTRALEAGLTGLEFAYGIPGSVGGAVYMNAGAYGGEMADVLAEVMAYDPEGGHTVLLPADALDLSYRHSVFMERDWVILGAVFALRPGDPTAIRAAMDDFMGRRRDKQPLDWPSAGSAFKRPDGAYAAALIDGCGLKGYRVGGAMVSEKHAGFVINAGGATSADVIRLLEDVRQKVKAETGYDLEPEIRIFQ